MAHEDSFRLNPTVQLYAQTLRALKKKKTEIIASWDAEGRIVTYFATQRTANPSYLIWPNDGYTFELLSCR